VVTARFLDAGLLKRVTAEADLLERRIVTIPAKDWKKFEAWASRPAEEIEGLRDLARKTPRWQE